MEDSLKIWSLNQELVDLLISRAGGRTTIKILDLILANPCNANQISNALNLDYHTIIYHTNIMQEHNFIKKAKVKRTYYFHPTEKLISNIIEYYYIKKLLTR